MNNSYLWIALGAAINLLMMLEQASAARGERVMPWQFLKERPYKILLMFAGAIVGYQMILEVTAVPSKVLLISVGWAGNDAIDKLTSVFATRYQRKNAGPPV